MHHQKGPELTPDDLKDLAKAGPFHFTLTPRTAFVLLTNLQLVLRNKWNGGAEARFITRLAQALEQHCSVNETWQHFCAVGWK